MNLRIVNETGMSKHTSVFDESGNDLAKYIREMTINFGLDGMVTADITLIHVEVELIAKLGLVLTERSADDE